MLTTSRNEFDEPGILLSEFISVRRRFLRSVNLEQDFGTANPLEGYLITTSGLAALERILEGVHRTHARAFSITGSYGSGKSAFALFASKVLAFGNDAPNAPRARIVQQQPELRERLPVNDAEGFLPILITGNRAPVARTLLAGLITSLEKSPLEYVEKVLRRLRKDYKAVLDAPHPASADVTKIFAEISGQLVKSVSGCRGLLVVVDEMGKFLEYAALYPDEGDLQVFQELAEYAARSEAAPLLLITILHQAFEEYAYRLSATQRREWQKVQGRFIDIPFGDGADETIRLIGQAITHDEARMDAPLVQRTLEDSMEQCRRFNLLTPSLSAGEFRNLLRNTYPIHPLTLCLLPSIFQRFGQSERSLFSFLSSDEPHCFQSFLQSHVLTDDAIPMLRPDHLYDHIIANLSSTIYSHSTAKLWSETEEALYRLRDQDPLQSRLVKTIGLLHILGEQTRTLPSKEILLFALADNEHSPQKIEAMLADLTTQTLIVYRQFKKAYRLYEGSDVDIEARLRDARAHFARGTDSVAVAARLEVTPPVVARQHSYRTGTLRSLEVRHCRPETLETEIRAGRGQSDGALLLCLTTDSNGMETVERIASEILPNHPEILLGASVETEALHEAAIAVDCLLWVQTETQELLHDRVAAREVRERLVDATFAFREEWERLLRPQGVEREGGVWYFQGQQVAIPSHRHLQNLVSRLCDTAYPATPIIQNELVNRRQLSSTASAARRNLIEGMIRRHDEPRLGIEGFPPEASMYVSVLENTGIHRPDANGKWTLQPPSAEHDQALAKIWNEIETFLFSDDMDAPTLTALNRKLRDKPYGLAEGVMPILICAALIYHEKEVAVYEDGRFVTELDAATFERMMKRPNDFNLRGCHIIGERQAVLDRFARGLLQAGEEATLINVVRKLYREFNRLPEYTTRTRILSPEAIALRDIFKESKEPEALLFVELPGIFDLRPFGDQEPDDAHVSEFFRRWNVTMFEVIRAYDQLLKKIEQQLCETFEVGDWEYLRDRAAEIKPYIAEPKLTGFAMRAADRTLARDKWIESVAASVIGRPPIGWNDKDLERFSNSLSTLARAFQHSELLHFEKQPQSAADGQSRVLLAVTEETGVETARVVLVQKANMDRVTLIAARLRETIEGVLQDQPQEIRLAALARIMNEMLQGGQND